MTPILYTPGTVHPWTTFHPYGRHAHDSYSEAESWRARRLPLDNYSPNMFYVPQDAASCT